MDITLHFIEKGSGTPMLLLHGNGEDHTYFAEQIEHFSSRFHVFAIDTRGHGQSPRGTMPFTIEQFAVDLYDFMIEHAIFSAILIGFSDGANIAMAFALSHPDMVTALILNGGNLTPRGVKVMTQFPIEVGYRIAKCFAARSPSAQSHAELLGLMVNEPNITPDMLSKIAVPTLVIAGTHDMIRSSHTKEIAAHLPHATLTFVQGDHFIANKRPAEFDRAVDTFLGTALG